MRTRAFRLIAALAFALWVSGAVLLAGCNPNEPAQVTPAPVATAAPAPSAVTTGNPGERARSATDVVVTSTPDLDRDSRDAAPAATPAPTSVATPAPATPAPTSVATPAPATPAPTSVATPAPATPAPTSVATPAPATSVLLQTDDTADATPVPVSESDWAPRLGSGAGASDPGRADASVPAVSAKGGASAASADPGVPYTWQDGDRTRSAWLQTDLVLQETSKNTADDVVVREGPEESIVERQPRHDGLSTQPVFRSDSGSLTTLPGGVLLVLDGEWSQTQVDTFFAGQGIAATRVEPQSFVPNAFLIETAPGLPSLELANALADEAGVLISSPNWRTEVELR